MNAFFADAVDVGRAVSHQAERVGAEIGLADVVAEDDEDVGTPAGWLRRGRRRLLRLRRVARPLAVSADAATSEVALRSRSRRCIPPPSRPETFRGLSLD